MKENLNSVDPASNDSEVANEFTTIKKPNGGIIILDAASLAYLQCTFPNPSQSSLDDVLSKATRIRVYAHGVSGNRRLDTFGQADPVIDSSDPEDLARVRRALRIEEQPAGHCMCHGDHALEFLGSDEQVICLLGLHHGRSIRWSAWRDDARLVDGFVLCDWFADKGLLAPSRELEAEKVRVAKEKAAWELWSATIPDCLCPLISELRRSRQPLQDEVAMRAYMSALARTCSSESEELLTVLRWNGSRPAMTKRLP